MTPFTSGTPARSSNPLNKSSGRCASGMPRVPRARLERSGLLDHGAACTRGLEGRVDMPRRVRARRCWRGVSSRCAAGLRRAVVHVTGLGHYELFVNGRNAGDDLFSPGWTGFDDSALSTTRDVTCCGAGGRNALGLISATACTTSFGGTGSRSSRDRSGRFEPSRRSARIRRRIGGVHRHRRTLAKAAGAVPFS